MQQIVTAGTAADALRINQIYQVQRREAYWVSGGTATPGSASTQIEVDIEAGEAQFGGSSTSWATTAVALDSASGDPRVDVVYVQQDGSLGVVTGTPHPYRPNQDEDGNAMTPSPFEHWEPSPDDGGNVIGLPLCCVLVEPSMADSTDLTTSHIQDRRLTTSTPEAETVGYWTTLNFPLTELDDGQYAKQIDTPDGNTAHLVGISARNQPLGTSGVVMEIRNGTGNTLHYTFNSNANGGYLYGSVDNPIVTINDPNIQVRLVNNTGSTAELSGKATFVYA